MRLDGGRPSPGMRAAVNLGESRTPVTITVLLVPREPAAATALFRHIVRMTNDPADRYAKGISELAAEFYDEPLQFDDAMAALFSKESELAGRLLDGRQCVLEFAENDQEFELTCDVRELGQNKPGWQYTRWHNRIFNPQSPSAIRVLEFAPQWERSWERPTR